MRHWIFLIAMFWSSLAMSIERPKFTLEKQDSDFEVRVYEPTLIAETIVEADFSEAGNLGFRRLANFIFGENVTQTKIDMTAPVSQQDPGEKIDMTAPVGQQSEGKKFRISFTMPSSYTMESLPRPKDPEIRIRQLPARRVAVITYSGTWTETRYQEKLDALRNWVAKQGLSVEGEPVFARYNPPIMPWFLRHNEILWDLRADATPTDVQK
jgi:effector-binding domain-containing protein